MAEDPLKRSTLRLFFALPLYPLFRYEVRSVLKNLQGKISGVRWVDPEQVHMTLHFFGPIPEDEILRIDVSIRKVAVLFSPFRIHLGQCGGFPNLLKPNIIWFGVQAPDGELTLLHEAMKTELRKLGLNTEMRPFHPHATLGRVEKARAGQPITLSIFPKELLRVEKIADHLVLYQSHLGSEGTRYEILKTYPFSKKI